MSNSEVITSATENLLFIIEEECQKAGNESTQEIHQLRTTIQDLLSDASVKSSLQSTQKLARREREIQKLRAQVAQLTEQLQYTRPNGPPFSAPLSSNDASSLGGFQLVVRPSPSSPALIFGSLWLSLWQELGIVIPENASLCSTEVLNLLSIAIARRQQEKRLRDEARTHIQNLQRDKNAMAAQHQTEISTLNTWVADLSAELGRVALAQGPLPGQPGHNGCSHNDL